MVGILSDIGNRRELNEDSVGYYEDDIKRIYVIADGVGGHNAGEVASKLAVDTTIDYIKPLKDITDMEIILKDAINYSNRKIYEQSMSDDNLNGMGTTITACLIHNDNLVVANVGDSSCYVICDNKIIKVTKDHSLVQQLVDAGSITEQQAVKHPNRNIITRSLGTNIVVEVDTFKLDLNNISKVILCTDGLSDEVRKDEIFQIVMEHNCKEACKRLIEVSKARGARDNISVIVFEGECKDDRYFTGE